jgi:hypothetical protein
MSTQDILRANLKDLTPAGERHPLPTRMLLPKNTASFEESIKALEQTRPSEARLLQKMLEEYVRKWACKGRNLSWLNLYADLIGGILGVLGSVILAVPLVKEIDDRRQWDGFADFLHRQSLDKQSVNNNGEINSETRRALQAVRDFMLNDRLGGYRRHRVVTLTGLAFLAASFAFMTIATVLRFLIPSQHGWGCCTDEAVAGTPMERSHSDLR